MASKVVVKDNRPKGSRRGKTCLTCVIVLAVIFVIFAGIIGGVGWYFGNMFTTEYLDMPLSDVTGVLNELYWANDKKVVKNGFSDDDRKEFYNEIKANILLKTDANINFDSELKRAVDAYLESLSEDGEEKNARLYNDSEFIDGENPGENPGENVGESGNDGEEQEDNALVSILVDMMTGIFTRDNIDLQRLHDYDEEHDEYVFNLRDKQLASFVQFVLSTVLEDPSMITSLTGMDESSLSMLDGIKLEELVALKQMRFYKVAGAANDIGEQSADATVADVTVWLGLQDAAGQALSKAVEEFGYGWASGLVKFAANMFLPKNVYATLTVPLNGDAQTQIALNGMSEKKRDNVYKLINGVMSLVDNGDGSGSDDGNSGEKSEGFVQSTLSVVGESIKPFLEAAADTIDYSSASTGTLKLDFIDTLAKFASQSVSPEDPVTKSEFMRLLQAVLTSDADNRLNQLEAYLYADWYIDGNGKYVRNPADTTELVKVDYERAFMDELEEKYAVDFGENATLDDVLDAIGISLGGESGEDSGEGGDNDILDLISAQKFKAALHKESEQLRLRVTDRMLGAVLGGQMQNLFGDNETLKNLNLTLDAITFVTKEENPGHTFARIAVQADVQGLTSAFADNAIGVLIGNILPQKIVLSMDVDITLNPAEGFEYIPAELMFNDYDRTGSILQTLNKLMPSFNLNDMTSQIEQPLRDMILQIDDAVGITLIPSVVTESGASSAWLEMEDIFSVVAGFALAGDDGKPVVSGEELQQVLLKLIDTDGFDDTSRIADDNYGFIDEITSKYYIDSPTELHSVDDITNFLQSEFRSSNFLIKSDNPQQGLYYMSTDDRSMEELEPSITGPQLGALLQLKMRAENGAGGNEVGANAQNDDGGEQPALSGIAAYDLLDVVIKENELELLLAVNTGDMLPEKISTVLDIRKIFVTVTVDLTEDDGEKYPVALKINNMDSTSKEFGDLKKIANLFDADFDVQSTVDELGKIMYTQMNNLKSSFGSGRSNKFVKFTDGAIKLASFYEYLEVKMNVENSTPETIRKAIQGMFARDDVNNSNNYDTSDFIVNLGSTGEYRYADLAGGMSDKVFNGYFENVIENDINRDGLLEAVQTVALAASNGSDRANAVRGWLNGRLASSERLADGDDYLAVTFRMAMNNFMNSSEMDKYSSFFPNDVYITVVFEKTVSGGKTVFARRGVVFNDMDAQTYELMTSLMRLSPSATDTDKVNINGIIDSCLTNLNKFGNVTVTFAADDTGKGGIGKITASMG